MEAIAGYLLFSWSFYFFSFLQSISLYLCLACVLFSYILLSYTLILYILYSQYSHFPVFYFSMFSFTYILPYPFYFTSFYSIHHTSLSSLHLPQHSLVHLPVYFSVLLPSLCLFSDFLILYPSFIFPPILLSLLYKISTLLYTLSFPHLVLLHSPPSLQKMKGLGQSAETRSFGNFSESLTRRPVNFRQWETRSYFRPMTL